MTQGSLSSALRASEVLSLRDRKRVGDIEHLTIEASGTVFDLFGPARIFDRDLAEQVRPTALLIASAGRRPVQTEFEKPKELRVYLESWHVNERNINGVASAMPPAGWTDFVDTEELEQLTSGVLPEYGISGERASDDFQIGRHRFLVEQLGEEGRILVEDAGKLTHLWLPVESEVSLKYALMGAIDGRCPELGN